MEIQIDKLSPGDAHKLLIGCIVPRPIAWITTLNPDGSVNVAPFSFFNGVCSSPPTISVSMSHGPGRRDGKKDTLLNIEREKEFVVNVVAEPHEEIMNESSCDFPEGMSECLELGLSTFPSRTIRTPRLAESRIRFECRLFKTVPVGDGPGSAVLVLGTIVHAAVDNALIDDGLHIDVESLRPIGRLAGTSYCYVRDSFSLPRPRYSGKSSTV
ncbi:MAG: flavin reductase family protein [Spirochaetaceae bacterium]|nr:MAG: flavin reductase family protein [Spirochaetaceae bacterium]